MHEPTIVIKLVNAYRLKHMHRYIFNDDQDWLSSTDYMSQDCLMPGDKGDFVMVLNNDGHEVRSLPSTHPSFKRMADRNNVDHYNTQLARRKNEAEKRVFIDNFKRCIEAYTQPLLQQEGLKLHEILWKHYDWCQIDTPQPNVVDEESLIRSMSDEIESEMRFTQKVTEALKSVVYYGDRHGPIKIMRDGTYINFPEEESLLHQIMENAEHGTVLSIPEINKEIDSL